VTIDPSQKGNNNPRSQNNFNFEKEKETQNAKNSGHDGNRTHGPKHAKLVLYH
jgi:hypothetical protein